MTPSCSPSNRSTPRAEFSARRSSPSRRTAHPTGRHSPRKLRSSSRWTRWLLSSAGGPPPAARRCCRSSKRTRLCCGTRSSTRASSSRRTSSTPAPPPTSRSFPAWITLRARARRRSSWSAATTSSPAPPTRRSRPTPQANGHGDRRRGVHSAGQPGGRHAGQQGRSTPSRTQSSTP